MADPILDPINIMTLKEIMPRVVEDNYFKGSPFSAYLRANCLVPFTGGAFIQQQFLYQPMIGGSYPKVGASFNMAKRQTVSAALFDPKYYEAGVPEYREDLQVLNKGPLAVFSMLDIDMENAVQTLSKIIAVALNLHGQASSAVITSNRPNDVNGWAEIINDGVLASWEGSVFTSYGTQARNGAIGAALNGNVFWWGNSDGSSAPLTYKKMLELYLTAKKGDDEPNLGVTNKAAYAYMLERIQPQQRFDQVQDPYFGASGLKMMKATVLADEYFPSLAYGVNDADLGNYLTSTFTSPNSSNNGFPASTTLTVGEVFCWFNTKKFLLRFSDDPFFQFGFSGFIPIVGTNQVFGTVQAACNVQCTSPRTQAQAYGIGA